MLRSELIALAKATAVKYGLIPSIVCGICEQESSWNADATRYESAFYVRYIEPLVNDGKLTDLTEAHNRATSWGLMQVMGQVAREMGYLGPFPYPDEATQIDLGCRKFAECVDAAHSYLVTALLHYNGGGNPFYANQVVAKSGAYQ